MLSRRLVSYVKSHTPIQKIIRKHYQTQTKPLSEYTDAITLKIGEKLHGFEVKTIQEIPDFRITAIYLTHSKTKAEYLHLYRNDNNNVFSVNFRTTPMNSTGLPHILEHTVLCGSEKFPIRDPFFKMLNRSLATFMNAMTGSDYTMYPFSTQNYSDYKNLQKIYLDAAFKPNLKELDFMQEGWRLENVDPNDIKSDLIIKGVVYNEMKGVFSENENILGQKLQNLILPDHTYGVISGGDPMDIPNLTWEDLKRFHQEHYHPSNSRFYSYGNFPLSPSLKYINDEYLSKYDYQEPKHTQVPKQTRWTEPKREHIFGRFENMREPFEKQNTISVSLLLSENTDIYETFLMQFLTQMLVKGPNSPFYKSMIEPNFSGGFTPTTGFDNQPRDCIFTLGLQGIKQDEFDKVLNLFDDTVNQVIEKGFDPEHIESVLHRYELSIKHETSNFGLGLLFGVTPIWNHNGDILTALQVNKLIGQLRREIEQNKSYLQDNVKKYFKDNKHKLILSMSPDKEFEEKIEKEEAKLIKKKVKKLSATDKKTIYEKCLELQKEQKKPQNIDILPTLKMDDICTDVEKVNVEHTSVANVQTQINTVNSNGILYFRAVLNTVELSPEQQMLLPLFCNVINKLGTQKYNYREFDNLVNTKTAGLNFHSHIGDSLYHLHSYEPGVLISSHCLEKNVESMWELWEAIFNIGELKDVARFETLVHLYMSNLTHGLADSGHFYAMQAAGGLVSGTGYQKELMSGLYHISYMKRLVATSNFKAVLAEISNIAKILFDKRKIRVALNLENDSKDSILSSYEKFVKNLPEISTTDPVSDSTFVTGKIWTPTDAVNCQHHVLNVPVNYCSKAILTTSYTNVEYAKLRVLARLLSSKYLHPELREKQGAYGGGARLTSDGIFTFYSYRDPRSVQTLDVFDQSLTWLKENIQTITDQDVFEAKLGVFQSIDSPIPPGSKGIEEFLRRLTPDTLQRHRAQILTVDKESLHDVAQKYLGGENSSLSGKVILGPKNDKVDVNKRPDELWTVIDS